MDYDGFHQMVLGANLKTVKEGQVSNIKDLRDKDEFIALNSHAKLQNIMTSNYEDPTEKIQIQELKQLAKNQKKNVNIAMPKNESEFQKYYMKEEDKLAYLMSVSEEVYLKIYQRPINSDLFL